MTKLFLLRMLLISILSVSAAPEEVQQMHLTHAQRAAMSLITQVIAIPAYERNPISPSRAMAFLKQNHGICEDVPGVCEKEELTNLGDIVVLGAGAALGIASTFAVQHALALWRIYRN